MAMVGGLPLAISLMMPAFVDEVLGTGAVSLGLLLAASACGAMISTLVVAKIGAGGRGRSLTITSFVLPFLLMGFAASRTFPVSCLILLGIGLVQSVLHALATTLIQVNVPDRVRGRVMSIYGMVIIGAPKLTGVLIGGVAEYLHLPLTIGLFSLLALFCALGVYAFAPSVRRLD